MAKKKKSALPAVNRGFATSSTPSKKPERSTANSTATSTGGTNTPNEELKKEIAEAYDRLEIGDTLGPSETGEGDQARNGDASGAAFDPEKEEEQALQNVVSRMQEKVDKEVSRIWKVSWSSPLIIGSTDSCIADL